MFLRIMIDGPSKVPPALDLVVIWTRNTCYSDFKRCQGSIRRHGKIESINYVCWLLSHNRIAFEAALSILKMADHYPLLKKVYEFFNVSSSTIF